MSTSRARDAADDMMALVLHVAVWKLLLLQAGAGPPGNPVASLMGPPPPAPLVIGPVFGQDYGGDDYYSVSLNSSSARSTQHYKAVAEECLARCIADTRCCAWTYCLPHSATEPGPERCCLKSGVPQLNTQSGCGWTGLAPRAVGPNNTVTSQCSGGKPPPPPTPPTPPISTFNTTTSFHPRTSAGGTGDASGVIQTADGRWHIFPDCHPTVDQARQNASFTPPHGYDGMGWAHISTGDLVHWADHGMAMQPGRVSTGGYVPSPCNRHGLLSLSVSLSLCVSLCCTYVARSRSRLTKTTTTC